MIGSPGEIGDRVPGGDRSILQSNQTGIQPRAVIVPFCPFRVIIFLVVCKLGGGIACCKNAGLVTKRLRARIPAEAAGEFSSPESTLCADSYLVSVPPPCYRSGT